MANSKRRQGLGKPAGDTLSAIDDSLAWLVESAQENCIKPGEFTTEMAIQKLQVAGITETDAAIRCRFDRMIKSGELKRRKIRINGRITNVFFKVT
jgi:hypothetical protein